MRVKKSILICIIIPLAFILCVLLTLGGVRSNKSRTVSTIFHLKSDIFSAAKFEGKQHPVAISDVLEMYRKDNRSISYKITEDGVAIKDAWDMPIIIEFQEPSIYKIISYGPNKKDDKGQGDDMYAVYDLSLENYKQIEQRGLLAIE